MNSYCMNRKTSIFPSYDLFKKYTLDTTKIIYPQNGSRTILKIELI